MTTNQGQRDYKQGQFKGFQIGAKRLQIGVGVLNWGKEILNQDRDYKSGQNIVQLFLITQNPNSKATKGYKGFSAPPVKWSKICYTFLSHELRKIKEMQQSQSYIFASCFPNLGRISELHRAFLSKRTKKSSRITKSLNYRGISVRVFREF